MNYWVDEHKKKVILPENLEGEIRNLKDSGKTIATLNGSFDLMHAGHLHIIYEASKAADILLVALNSDSSIKMYKSPERPIITLEYRMQMMCALQFVDYATWFEEADPIKFLNTVKPDVHVNGAEYGKECLEAETVLKNGGRLHIVELVPGLSTSSILDKIRALKV